MNTTSTVTSKYQVVIPKKIRQKVKVKQGDKVSVHALGDLIVIQKYGKNQSWADSLWGLGKDAWKKVDPVAYVHNERKQWK